MRHFPPQLALSLSSLFWAGNFIVGRAMRDQVQPVPLNFWRWSIAFMILLYFSFGAVRRHRLLLFKHWRLVLLLAMTGIAGFHIGVYTALQTTSAINALLFLSITPVLIVIGSRILFHEPIQIMQVAGIFISLSGVVVLLVRGDPARLLGLQFNGGDLWMLMAVLLWSIYSVILKHKPPELPQAALLTSTIFLGLVIMLPLFLAVKPPGPGLQLDTSTIGGLLYISIFASVVAYFCWNYGVSRIGPNKAGAFLHLMPLFGALLAMLFLGEAIHAYHLGGAVLIAAGIALTNRVKTVLAGTDKAHRS
jgi:drug/metabolite transporter (DMT)-like permease